MTRMRTICSPHKMCSLSLLLVLYVFLHGIKGQTAPGNPTVAVSPTNSPQEGQTVTFTCTSVGGDPTPTMAWYNGSTVVSSSYTTTDVGGIPSTSVSFTFVVTFADINSNFKCTAMNSALVEPRTKSWQLYVVYVLPTEPRLQMDNVAITSSTITVTAGVPIQFKCIVDRTYPMPIIEWSLGNSKVFSGVTETPGITNGDSTYRKESIINLTPTSLDDGNYLRCDASQSSTGTNVYNQVLLNVVANLPSVSVANTVYKELVGFPVTLQCSVTLADSVTWLKDDQVINTGLSRYSGGTPFYPSLNISSISASDRGGYVCRASNSGGNANSPTISLGILATVTVSSTSILKGLGDQVTLTCNIGSSATTVTNVYWTYSSSSVGSQTTLAITGRFSGGTLTNPSLTISSLVSGDQGYYRCVAVNADGDSPSTPVYLGVSDTRPVVSISTDTYASTTGQTVTLNCAVSGSPAATSVYWTRIANGNVISTISTSSNKYSGSLVNSPSLVITDVDTNDAGNYRCNAVNNAGVSSSPNIYLGVTGSAPQVSVGSSTTYSVVSGQDVTLYCAVSSTSGVSTVYWNFYGNNLGGSPTQVNVALSRYSGGTTSNPSLTIGGATSSDSGYYRCVASNSIGTTESTPLTLTVSGSVPIITVNSNAYTATAGNQVILQCSVSAQPSATSVYWERLINGQYSRLTIDGFSYGGVNLGSPSLVIYSVNSADSGTYRCAAENSVGTGYGTSISLSVSANAPTVTVPQQVYSVTTGTQVTLQCSVSASPAASLVYWEKENNGIYSSLPSSVNKYSGGSVNSPSLTIFSTQVSDSGTYRCVAVNSAGTGQSLPVSLSVSGTVPTISVGQTSYSQSQGSQTVLSCAVSGNPAPSSVYWQRLISGQYQTISIDGSKYGGVTLSSPSLIIYNSQISDSGTYRCGASNSVGTATSSAISLSVTGNVPTITVSQTSYTAAVGDSVQLQCSVSGSPAVTSVYWQRYSAGTYTPISINGLDYGGATVNGPSLTIYNVDTADSGSYVCSAENSIGSASSTFISLTVSGTLPTVSVSQFYYSITSGATVTLQCNVFGSPAVTSVFWKKLVNNAYTQLTIDGTNYGGSSVNSASLIVYAADVNDSGQYKCGATNSVGSSESNSIQLQVSGNVPSVSSSQTSYSVQVGSSVTLQCIASGNPAVSSVFWQKYNNNNYQTITIDGSKYSGGSVGSPSLTITNANNNDAGTYRCGATNSVGTGYSQSLLLSVSGSLPVVTVPQTSYSGVAGTTTTLQCQVSGNPDPFDVFWQRFSNGQYSTISINFNKYQGSTINSPSLVIRNSEVSDSGIYRCGATNSVGNNYSNQVTLSITGEIPTVIVSQSSYGITTGQSVTLQCSVSANPAVSSVSWERLINGAYTRITIDGSKYTIGSLSDPYLTISGSTSSDSGTYRCAATNTVGTGYSQDISLFVTGSLPQVTVAQTSYSVTTGSALTLQCSVSGNPAVSEVFWQRLINGQFATLTIDNSKYSGSLVGSPSLVIQSPTSSDSGTYRCGASNSVGTDYSSQVSLSVTGNVPVVTVGQVSYSRVTGTETILACSVSGSPAVSSVFWQKYINNQYTTLTIDGSKFAGSNSSYPSLIIRSSQPSDSGQYRCGATNQVGTSTSSTVSLTVTGSIPVLSVPQTVYSITLGMPVTLICTVSAVPSATSVSWERNGVPITIDNMSYLGGSVSSPSLQISSVNNGDAGSYVCKASNQVGTGASSTITLSVTGSVPIVAVAREDYSVTTGSSVILQCSVSANPSATSVGWEKLIGTSSAALSIDGNKYSGVTLSSPSLTINSLADSDSGNYRCVATNSVGTSRSNVVTLTVTGSIPTAVIGVASFSVTRNSSLTIPCTISGSPSPSSVAWERSSNGIVTAITVDGLSYTGSTVQNPSLTITRAVYGDQGYYVCKVTNSVGTATSDATYVYVTGNVPVVTIGQSSYSVLTSQSITIQCSIQSESQVLNVEWQRRINNVYMIVTIENNKYTGGTVGNPSLTINSASASDAGQYICLATNMDGTGTSGFTLLSVTGDLPSVTIDKSSYSVITGNSITIQCSVTGSPGATSVSWKLIQGATSTDISLNQNKYSGSTVSNPSLTIYNAQDSDEGYYVCQATNAVGTGLSNQAYLSVSGSIPVVEIGQNTYSTTTGTSVTLTCTATGIPAPSSVTWEYTKNNVQTNIVVDGQRYLGGNVNVASLTIVNPTSNDEGSYVCTATNSIGTGRSAATYLFVTGSLPVVTASPTSYQVTIGSSVTLQCSVSANPSATSVQWKRTISGQTTDISMSNINFEGSTVNNPSLTIRQTATSDQGSYVCTATNSVGTGTSSVVYLSVTGNVPTVTVSQTTYSVTTGVAVTLQCSVSAIPQATSVTWSRVSGGVTSTIDTSNIRYNGATVNNPSLEILSVIPGDSGQYTCQATNTVGTGSSQAVTLSVSGSIPSVTIPESSYSFTTGTTATLPCDISAIPAVSSVSWFRTDGVNETPIVINGIKYQGSQTSAPALIISQINSDDQGYYICKASNSVGTGESRQTYLTVAGSLPIVTIQQSTYSVTKGGTVTLVCSVAATPQITSIEWRRTSGGQTEAVTIDGSHYSGATVNNPSLIISDADSADAATYVCTATNVVGTGQSLQAVLSVTGDIPTVSIAQSSYSVNTGSPITLICTVSATPQAFSVFWQRIINGVMTTMNIDGVNYQGGSVNTPSLTINSATNSDQGYYICSATNVVGTGSSSQSFLTVAGGQPVVSIPESSYTVITGNDITIPCSVQASPSASSVTWQRISNGITTGINVNSAKYSGGTVNTPSLTISTTTSTDQGYYVCSASNSIGIGQSGQAYLTVTGSIPSVTIPQQQYTVLVGQSITIECDVTASPAYTSVSWERVLGNDKTTLTIDNDSLQGGTVNNPSLTIKSANNNDQGYYVCVALNSVGIGRSSQTYLQVTGTVPIVAIGSSSYTVVIGNTVTLTCSITGSPAATSVTWQRTVGTDTGDITIDGTKYIGGTVNSPDLEIRNAVPSDQGYYRCVAFNIIGRGQSASTYLYVTGNLPKVTVPQQSYSVALDDPVTLGCSVTGTPTPSSIMWEFTNQNGDTTTLSIDGSRYTGGTLSNPALTINKAAIADHGIYVCKASNSVGMGSSDPVYLYVTGGVPLVQIPESTYSEKVGSSITLGCTISANPAVTLVYWQIVDGVTIRNVSMVAGYTGSTPSVPSLTITQLKTTDTGAYRCVAMNNVGTGTSSLTALTVQYAPQNTVVVPSQMTVTEGESISAECSTSGVPAPSVAWFKNSAILASESNLINTLLITNVERGHAGQYVCRATNSIGEQSANLNVTVRYRPVSTVTQDSATRTVALGTTISLSCNTVSFPGVTGYQWFKTNSQIPNANNQVYTVTVDDTGDYATYTCYATNAVGQSNAIQFTVQQSGASPDTGGSANTGASTASSGLTSGEIAAIVLALLFLLLLILLIIFCCYIQGCCGTICGKKKKPKGAVQPQPTKTKEVIKTIEIPRYVEKPVYIEKPYRETSAVSRQDVVIGEESFDILRYQTIPPAGTSMMTGYESTQGELTARAPRRLPALETETYQEEERRRRKRRKHRKRKKREEREGELEGEVSRSRSRSARRTHEVDGYQNGRLVTNDEYLTVGDMDSNYYYAEA